MELVIRKGSDLGWGFVEKYSIYQNENRMKVSVVVGISPEGYMVNPYVYRGKEFIEASSIDEEVGIKKYIKAKKPFYSLLNDGFIANIESAFVYDSGELIKEKCGYTIYSATQWELSTAIEGRLLLVSVLDVPPELSVLMQRIQKDIAKCRGDREQFLKNRMKEKVVE